MKSRLKLKIFLVFSLALLVAGGWFAKDIMTPYQGYGGEAIVEIPPGTGIRTAAGSLQQGGMLEYRRPFLILYMLLRPWHGIQAGEYLFDRPLRPWDVYWKLIHGEVRHYPLTIPEGFDIFDISRTVSQQLSIPEADFMEVARDASLIRNLDPEAETLEGYLFPDTYHFSRQTTARDVAKTIVDRFRKVLEELGPTVGKDSTNLRKIITMASLIEKETDKGSERALVSGVFHNRLRLGYPLQCDPTVVYAARLNNRDVGVIRQSDLDFDSPYNTYRRRGLPPGPICNPGRDAIRATLEPAEGNYLYFVSDNHGGHVFSRTGAEHARAVADYRRELRRQAAERAERKQEGSQSSSRGE